MKAIKLLLIVLVCFFVSCIPWKKTVKTKEDVKITTNVELKKDSQEVAKTDVRSVFFSEDEIKKIEEKTAEFNSHLIIYDTDKPVDKKTGRPPIKAELIKNSKTNHKEVSDKNSVVNSVIEDKSVKETKLKTNLVVKSKIKKKLETEETVSSGFNALIIISVIVLFVILLLLWYSKFVKKINIFSKFWKLLFK